MLDRVLLTIGLPVLSNIFMTFAWYYHIRQRHWPLLTAILLSWLIALPEYCLQVPANRVGHVNFNGALTAPQLKVLQEAITLIVFSVFSIVALGERIRVNDAAAFALVFLAVVVSWWGRT